MQFLSYSKKYLKLYLSEILHFPWILIFVYIVTLLALYSVFGNNLEGKLTQSMFVTISTQDVRASFIFLVVWILILTGIGAITRKRFPRMSTIIAVGSVYLVILFSLLYFSTLRILLNLE